MTHESRNREVVTVTVPVIDGLPTMKAYNGMVVAAQGWAAKWTLDDNARTVTLTGQRVDVDWVLARATARRIFEKRVAADAITSARPAKSLDVIVEVAR